MSTALWCDKGDHAFSAKDPLKQHFSQTQTVTVPTGNNYGRTTYEERREVTEELDICGPCWSRANPFSPDAEKPTGKHAKAEIDSRGVTRYGYDPETEKTEEYLRGYHDAKEESE